MIWIWRKFISWRHRLDRIPSIDPTECATLKPNYPDQDALQAALDSSAESPVQRVAAVANLDVQRVAELLGASLDQSAEALTSGWLSRHWTDLLLLAGIVFLAMLPTLGKMEDDSKKAQAEAKAARSEQEPHGVATRDLLPTCPLNLAIFGRPLSSELRRSSVVGAQHSPG